MSRCLCGRPVKLSGRVQVCAVCWRGVKHPRTTYRKRALNNYEKAWQLRRQMRKAA